MKYNEPTQGIAKHEFILNENEEMGTIIREVTYPDGIVERYSGAFYKVVIDKQTKVAKRVYISIPNQEGLIKYYRMSFIIVDDTVIKLTGRYSCYL